MRVLTPAALMLTLILAACSSEPEAAAGVAAGLFAGAGRDRLCVAGEGAGQRAGLIVYAASGDTNCSATGRIAGGALVPSGDRECRIPLTFDAAGARIGAVPRACAYYCGPGASLDGKTFRKSDAATPATDLAGDPLC